MNRQEAPGDKGTGLCYARAGGLEFQIMTLTVNLPPATTAASLRDILAPIHEDFRKSGMSEQELDLLIDEAMSEARAARKSNHPA
jgi:hypothetical protein